MYKEFKENKNKIDEELDRLRQEREDLSKQLKLQQNKLE